MSDCKATPALSSWEHSESITEIAQAMNKVNARGIVYGKDASGRFSYVSLEKIIEKLLPTLAEQGLSIMQPLDNINGKPAIRTLVMHVSGEWYSTLFPIESVHLQGASSGQEQGAGITYTKRYALVSTAVVGVGDSDLDALDAQPRIIPKAEQGKGGEPGAATPAKKVIERISEACKMGDFSEAKDIMRRNEATLTGSRKFSAAKEFIAEQEAEFIRRAKP